MAQTYADRNRVLQSMGFFDYEEYLSSDLWSSIRSRAYEQHGRSCRLCDSVASQIHHMSYSLAVLTGESLKPFIPLCGICHYKIEFDSRHGKRTIIGMQGAYNRLSNSYRRQKELTLEGRKSLPNHCKDCGFKLKKVMKEFRCVSCRDGVVKPELLLKLERVQNHITKRKKRSKPWIGLAHRDKYLAKKLNRDILAYSSKKVRSNSC